MILPPDRFSAAERIVAHDGPHAFEAVVPPIVQTSLFTFATVSDMVETYAGRRSRDVYSRTTNPTVSLFEAKMAALEGGEEAIGFPSGMAAISGSVLAFVAPGDRILCVRHVYPDAYRLFETLMRRLGVSVDYVDGGATSRPSRPRCRAPSSSISKARRAGPWRPTMSGLWRRWRGSTAP